MNHRNATTLIFSALILIGAAGCGEAGEQPANETKFLVNGDGEVVARFEPSVDPMDDTVVEAIEALLPPAS